MGRSRGTLPDRPTFTVLQPFEDNPVASISVAYNVRFNDVILIDVLRPSMVVWETVIDNNNVNGDNG